MSDKVMIDRATLEKILHRVRVMTAQAVRDERYHPAQNFMELEMYLKPLLSLPAALAPASTSSSGAEAGVVYAYAEDAEGWNWEGGFASREDAEREGREEYPEGFSTGRCRTATLKDVYPGGMAETLIDRIGEDYESGTPLEGYAEKINELVIRPALGGKDTRLLGLLEKALMAAFEGWATEHLPRPDWFYMEDVQPASALAGAE